MFLREELLLNQKTEENLWEQKIYQQERNLSL